MKRIAWIFVIALVVGLVPAMADSWTWTFTDNTGVVASGTLSGSSMGPGVFNITSGTITDVTIGAGNLYADATPGVVKTSPPGTSNYDDLLYTAFPPLVDNSGLLFYTDITNPTAATEMNIYSTGTTSYYRYQGSGGLGNPGDAGTFAIQGTPDGGTTLSLLGLAIVGLAGLRRKLSL
jgi:hypothetical protein